MPVPDDRSDEELLQLARDDAEAFAALYDRHAGPIAGWLARRAHPDLAQDLFAETFAQAWCDRRRFRPAKGSAAGWLYGIAQHLLHQSYRRLAVEDRGRRRLGIATVAAPAESDDADRRLDAAGLRTELDAALASLSPGVRAAVLLRVVEQRGYDEIGAALGCTTQSARVRVSRGLRTLRDVPVPGTASAPTDGPASRGAPDRPVRAPVRSRPGARAPSVVGPPGPPSVVARSLGPSAAVGPAGPAVVARPAVAPSSSAIATPTPGARS